MNQSQEKFSINVSFEGKFAQCLIEMAKIQNRTIEEVIKDLVEEDDEIDEEDIALARLAASRNMPGAKRVKYEDITWR